MNNKFDTSWYDKFFKTNQRQKNFNPTRTLPENPEFTLKPKDASTEEKKETTKNNGYLEINH